jgi:hypothetical protein
VSFSVDPADKTRFKNVFATGENAYSQTAPKGVPTAEATETPKEKISDVGAKLGGARKDRWRGRGLDLSDLQTMTAGEEAEQRRMPDGSTLYFEERRTGRKERAGLPCGSIPPRLMPRRSSRPSIPTPEAMAEMKLS